MISNFCQPTHANKPFQTMLAPFTYDFAGIGAYKFALYVGAETLMAVSPGAAVLLVLARGLSRGFGASLAVTAGILSANALYFIASALGLTAIAIALPTLFKALQWAGAAYLIYLAWGCWVARPGGLSLSQPSQLSHWGAYRQALLTQLANPKAMLTFAAIVPPFVNTAAPVAPQMVWLWLGSGVPELVILAAYGGLAARMQSMLNHPARLRAIERLCAVLLLAIALMIVWV